MTEPNQEPEDFEALLKRFLQGEPIDPNLLAGAAGLSLDPSVLGNLVSQISQAVSKGDDDSGINWPLAEQQALDIARMSQAPIEEKIGDQILNAASTASLWLDEATIFSSSNMEPKLLSRELWVRDSLGLFRDLATPIAERMSVALTENFKENLPEEFSGFMMQASGIMKSAGSVMFAMQLGQALGKLSEEVLTGGDIGLPIFEQARPGFVVQNLEEFARTQEDDIDQVYLYLAAREIAHARLFKNSKWLRDYIVNLITNYARDITIDNSKIVELSENFDPNDFETIQAAMEAGALISPRTDDQNKALEQIETVLALIEGWVDSVTVEATKRLPRAQAISELIRRKRVTSGPAEKTFLTLIGLELRPRKLREASKLWSRVLEELGQEVRDSIWSHPDLLPQASDITDPAQLIRRLTGDGDDFDSALRDLLS
jgi:putative hydrolase